MSGVPRCSSPLDQPPPRATNHTALRFRGIGSAIPVGSAHDDKLRPLRWRNVLVCWIWERLLCAFCLRSLRSGGVPLDCGHLQVAAWGQPACCSELPKVVGDLPIRLGRNGLMRKRWADEIEIKPVPERAWLRRLGGRCGRGFPLGRRCFWFAG